MNNRADNPGPNPGNGLFGRAAVGAMWSSVAGLGGRGLGFVRTLILARLLLPEDFGIVGIAITIAGALEAFTTSGLQAAIVQRKDTSREVLDTAWTLTLLRGTCLAGMLFVFADPLAGFFDEAAVADVIRFFALNRLLAGGVNIGLTLLQKDLLFRERARYDLAADALTTVITIAAAWVLRSYWALVIGELSGAAIRVLLSYVVHPYRPRLRWDRKLARELFDFGRHILAFRMIDYLLISGDDLFVGKILGHEQLGFYLLAYQIANLPATLVSRTVSGVLFPTLSKIQDDPESVVDVFSRALRLVALLSIPSGAWLCVFADPATRILFGDPWLPMVPALRVLAIYGTLRSVGYLDGPLLQSLGRPDILRNAGALQLAVVAAVIWPLTAAYELPGTALGIVAGICVFDLFAGLGAGRILAVPPWRLLHGSFGPLAVSVLSIGCAVGFARVSAGFGFGHLIASGLLVAGIQAAATALFLPELAAEIKRLARSAGRSGQ